MYTFIGSKTKPIWIVVALERETRKVVDFYVGPRTKRSLRMVVNTLLASETTQLTTDRLNLYKTLIPEQLHNLERYANNHVERMNLNTRTHLKRLSRRSICFSKQKDMLIACLIIYFWR
ncbi:IS1 family transposase [Ekhidna sp. To15]|uniref:IS1 family transposase n=1 Tax=Ekhidna sp. To15 TaxID=3395267 RepID=UPI003F52237F